ncbi:type II toxin-antitoxin system HicA family toxin [Okibacterium fritillariae]|uniref:type II toxin-antitoxin system HicA family toxin n=1 Tax=Okibacterium fritillariae TaxID=123320 RepID=UPI0040559BCA
MTKEVKQREVERFLRRAGWRLVRVRGGHSVWSSGDGRLTLAIPRHGVVSPGVVRQIIKVVPNAPESWR